MFGDKLLAGQNEISVDPKNRIFLPTNTGRENGDEVYFVYDEDIDRYAIYSEKTFVEKVEQLEELMNNASSEEKRIQYKLLLYHFFESVLKKCTVDKQGRIVLGEYFEKGETITSIGAKDHLILVRKTDKKKNK